MARPVLVKLGGSLLTDKAGEGKFQKAVARRLLAELGKAGLPVVILHGAGSYGHPPVARHGIGQGPMTQAKREGVSEVLARVGELQAEVVALAHDVGLRPVALPLHAFASREDGNLLGLPIAETKRLLDEGHAPVMSGTLTRDSRTGWSVTGADELMQEFAQELEPRLAVFATDVDGIYDRDPRSVATDEAAHLLARIRPGDESGIDGSNGLGDDVTGRMSGKLVRALAMARTCPVLIVNGTEKNRLLDALRGKQVVCTRVEA